MSKLRDKIRSQIRPMPRIPTYPTSWNGEMTFQQIYNNLAHYATNIMKSKGIHRTNHLPDCLQHGFMALWLELTKNRDFLTEKTRQQAVFFILARCKISSYRYNDQKFDSLEEMLSYDRRQTWDELTITGFTSPSGWWKSVEKWAPWATALDIRIDVERIIGKLAAKYANSFEHLVALYAVTTQVTYRDAAEIAGIPPTTWQRNYIHPMIAEVQFEFAEVFLEQHDYTMPEPKNLDEPHLGRYKSPYTEWREQYESGYTAPAEALLQQYSHTICVAGALRAQIAGKTYKQAAIDMGRNPSTFPKYMKRAARMLAAAYA